MKRSALEMVITLLRVINHHPNFASSRICNLANINYLGTRKGQIGGKELLNSLTINGYVNQKAEGKKFRYLFLTEKGKKLLQLWDFLLSDLKLADGKAVSVTTVNFLALEGWVRENG